MARALTAFTRQALRGFGDRLTAVDLRRQALTNFCLQVNPEVTGLVGLTVITEPLNEERVQLSVELGLRHEDLESLVCELTGQAFDLRTTASLATSLGYVTPHRAYTQFSFTPDTFVEVVREAGELVAEYGVPWLRQYDSLDKILDALLEGKYTYNDAARLRIPTLY
jgi:hypothetical protein